MNGQELTLNVSKEKSNNLKREVFIELVDHEETNLDLIVEFLAKNFIKKMSLGATSDK